MIKTELGERVADGENYGKKGRAVLVVGAVIFGLMLLVSIDWPTVVIIG